MDPALLWILYVAVAAAAIGLMAAAGVWFASKRSSSKAWLLFNEVWVTVQAVVAHAEVHIRPKMKVWLADGKLDPEERKALAAEMLRLAKEALILRLDELKRVFRLTDHGLDLWLSGLIEWAQRALLSGGTPGAPPPTATPPPATPQRAQSFELPPRP